MFVETSGRVDRRSRLVVKQAHTLRPSTGFAGPLMAAQEFEALTRLHHHFQQGDGRLRVPEPVQLFPDLGAFAMEYVPGLSLRDLLRYSTLLRPRRLLDGLAAAAEFIGRVHDLESFPDRPVDLRAEAKEVLAGAENRLQPVGLELPRRVSTALQRVPPVVVDCRQVWLHGDFYPSNIILGEDGSTVGIDPALDTVGAPEEDLARFVSVMSGGTWFSPEVLAPPVSWIRQRLETQLLQRYYGTTRYPPLFELKLVPQLVHRWLHACQVARQHERRSLLAVRLHVIHAQFRLLMEQSAGRLERSLGS
jgi:serine/threonine protein kinase